MKSKATFILHFVWYGLPTFSESNPSPIMFHFETRYRSKIDCKCFMLVLECQHVRCFHVFTHLYPMSLWLLSPQSLTVVASITFALCFHLKSWTSGLTEVLLWKEEVNQVIFKKPFQKLYLWEEHTGLWTKSQQWSSLLEKDSRQHGTKWTAAILGQNDICLSCLTEGPLTTQA